MAQKTVSVRLSVEADNLDGIRKKLEELGATVKTVGNDNSADKLRRSLEGLEGRLDPAARAAQRLVRDTETLNKSLAEGAVSQERYNDLMAKSQAAYAQATSGATGQSKALADLHGATKMSYESQQILRSGLINTFQSISAGLPIGQTLLTQTTQTAPAFVEMAKGASLSTAALVGFAVPTVAAAAAAGLVAARLATISSEAKQLAAITTALNPNLGATAEQLRAISFAVADQGVSRATGMAALTAVIRDTRIQSAGLAEQIAKVSVDVAAVMGGEVPDWAKKIGEAAATGSQGFDKLLSTLPGITAETMKAVRAAEQHGDRLGATKIAVDALEKQFNGSAKAMKGSWDSAVHDMTTAWDVFMERVATSDFSNTVARGFSVMGKGIADVLRSPTISEEIVGLNRKLVSAQDELARLQNMDGAYGGTNPVALAAAEARVKDLESRVNVLIDKARTEARAAEDAQTAAGTGKIGGLNENELNKLNLAVEATKRQALASDLLSKNLSVTARAAAENRIALADMAMQYPALGAGTAKSILESRDFAATLKTLPPELQNVFKAMQNNSANKLAGDVAQAGVALSSAAYAAKMHAEAAGMGEAAMRAASIEAEVYAHRMDGTADAVRAALDEQERYVRAGIQQEFEQGINRQIEANDRLIAAYGVSGKAVEDASRSNEAYLQTLKEYPESMKNLPAYEDLWTAALNRNIDKLKERDLSKQAKDVAAYAEKIKAAQEDLSIDRAAAGMSDLAALDLKARYDALKAMNYTIERYSALNDAARQQVNIQLDVAASIAQQQQEVKNYADAWATVNNSLEKSFERIGDSLVSAIVDGKNASLDFEKLWKSIAASMFSDFAKLASVDLRRALGLGGNTQGSLLDLFGGSTSPQSPLTGQAANQNGGLSSFTNGSFGLSNLSGGWLDRQLGGGLTGVSDFLSSPITGNSAQMFGGGFDTALAAQNASPLGTLSWGQGIGGAAGLISGGMQIANGNVIGGGGQMIGSALTLAGMPEIGIPIQILSSVLGGLFGKDRGKPAAAANVEYTGTKLTGGGQATDNEGDAAQAKQLHDSINAATAKFMLSSGAKTPNGAFGIGAEAKDGKYRAYTGAGDAGSFGTLDEAVIAGFRKNVADGLISASDDVMKAVKNSTKTDINDFMKDVTLGKDFRAQFDAMNAALDPTNNQIKTYTENAKALGEQVKTSILDWKDSAKELGLATDEELVSAARKGITAMLGLGPAVEPLRGMEAVTKQAVIQFEAFSPALSALGYTAAEVADLASQYTAKLVKARDDALTLTKNQGAAAIAALTDPLAKTSVSDRFTGLGLDPSNSVIAGLAQVIGNVEAAARAGTLSINDERSALAALNTQLDAGYLTADQYGSAVGLLTQAWQDSATAAEAAATKVQAAQDLSVRTLAAQGKTTESDSLALQLKQEREYAQAVKDGYNGSYLGGLLYVQGLEKQAAATAAATAAAEKAAAAQQYQADVTSRMYAAVGNDRSSQLYALDQQQAVALAQAKASGYDTTQLEQTQAAERAAKAFQLAQADVVGAIDQQITPQQALVTSLQSGAVAAAQTARSFRQMYDSLALNDNSPLSPKQKLDEAARQVEAAYQTAKSATASDADKDAARQSLLTLGSTYIDADRSYNASSSTVAYDRMRQIAAEFGDLQSQGLDTADKQLEAANKTLAELQRQRSDAAALGQKQYGALNGLQDVLQQSFVLWQDKLLPLLTATGTASNVAHYSAPAAVQAAWDGLGVGQRQALAQSVGWTQSDLGSAFNSYVASSTGRISTFEANSLALAGGQKYAANDTVGGAWAGLTDAQRAAALRSAGWLGTVSDGYAGANAWVSLGHQQAFEAALLAEAHKDGVPGYATGGVVTNGTWNQDSVLAWLAGGEHITRASSVNAQTAPILDWVNRTGTPPANDRWGGNVAEYPRRQTPAPTGTDPETKQLLREISGKLDTLTRVSMGAGDGTHAGLRQVAEGVAAVVRKVGNGGTR